MAMVSSVEQALQDNNVEYLVAPYEADAQLAYLATNGLVDAIISEDSDLLAYGCPRVLFKMDKDGNAKQIQINDLGNCFSPKFTNFTHEQFRYVCILSGCDYLASPKNMGIKTAISLLNRHQDIQRVCLVGWLVGWLFQSHQVLTYSMLGCVDSCFAFFESIARTRWHRITKSSFIVPI
jgi:5'-3' exonuclease